MRTKIGSECFAMPGVIHLWAADYPTAYDAFYTPYIELAREGDLDAVEKLMWWKNPSRGKSPRPMPPSRNKRKPWNLFMQRISQYRAPGGKSSFREDFADRSPVYAAFMEHILFGSPIFDIHTHRAYVFFTTGRLLVGRAAAIPRKDHFNLYDSYCEWFVQLLKLLQFQDVTITERDLDRALMRWGMAHKNGMR